MDSCYAATWIECGGYVGCKTYELIPLKLFFVASSGVSNANCYLFVEAL